MNDKILVDTSVWIEFFRKKDSKVSGALKELLIKEMAAVAGAIFIELYRGAYSEKEIEFLDDFLLSVHYIPTTEGLYKKAGLLGYNLSKKGAHIGTVDLLIAQTAMENNIPLYTQDNHFKEIAKHSSLVLYP
ncbi:MAG: PIN domain-containing protein [Nitrospirae bacterium]|nr:PIN domain-containing protein [Nitrospirota bacterium]